jgi:hypothetical protein
MTGKGQIIFGSNYRSKAIPLHKRQYLLLIGKLIERGDVHNTKLRYS